MTSVVTRTMSRRLGEYVHGLRYADIPDDVVEQVKHHVGHGLSLALGGHSTVDGQRALGLARRLSGDTGPHPVIGTRHRLNLLDAVFANGGLMQSAGPDDVLFPVGVHAGLVTMPIAFVLGEQYARSGRDVITALVAAYDAIGKLGRPVWMWSASTPRRPTIAFGPFGAAAVAARLLSLDPERTAQAIGYAAHSAMGLAEGNLVTHYYALVARNGLTGALAAQEGGVASDSVLEGEFGFFRTFCAGVPDDLAESLDTLGSTFEFTDAIIKRYPSTGLNIVPVELMADLTRRHGLTPATVERIRLELPVERANFAIGHAPGPFADRRAAASSAQFNLAIVLADGGNVDLTRYDRFDDPDVAAIVDRVDLALVPHRPIRYARVVVTTTDGRTFDVAADTHDFPYPDLAAKLVDSGRGLLPEQRLRDVAGLVARLDELDDVGEIVRALTPA